MTTAASVGGNREQRGALILFGDRDPLSTELATKRMGMHWIGKTPYHVIPHSRFLSWQLICSVSQRTHAAKLVHAVDHRTYCARRNTDQDSVWKIPADPQHTACHWSVPSTPHRCNIWQWTSHVRGHSRKTKRWHAGRIILLNWINYRLWTYMLASMNAGIGQHTRVLRRFGCKARSFVRQRVRCRVHRLSQYRTTHCTGATRAKYVSRLGGPTA
jgi:hypothetical protein